MKKIKLILSIVVAGLAFGSCEDFLKEDNRSNVTAEDFYIKAEGFESLINANYSQLRNIYGDEPWLFSAGTDMYAEGRNAEPPGLSRYTQLNPNSEGVGQLYNTGYQAIQTANMAMYYSDITEETSDLNTRIGEVKYLRAHAYFLLVQTYGGVPLITEYFTEPKLQFSRNSAEEVYEFIISELEESLNMVSAGAYNGRVTKRAVQHLLAKVHLTRGYEDFGNSNDFATAASYADDAIAGQPLTIPFGELWAPGNEMNDEVLFSVQYSPGSVSVDPFNLGNRQNTYFGPYQGGSEVAGNAPYRTYTLLPTQYAIDLFTQEDERWNATFMEETYVRYFDYYDVPEDQHSSLNVLHYYAPQWKSSDAHMQQYLAENPGATYHPYGSYVPSVNPSTDYQTIPVKKFDDPNAPYGEKTSTRDIILSRLAETYLIAAEAYLQAGDAATGLMRLNEVRNRAGVDDATMAEFDIHFILDERGRELLGEYHRWFDLKRTGTLVERASQHHFLIEPGNFAGANGELKILRPIPQDAIDLNQNEDFEQNPAYQQ